jgi:hypothetical protein
LQCLGAKKSGKTMMTETATFGHATKDVDHSALLGVSQSALKG